MIGVPISEPNTPGFVIVNVPSCTSRGSRRFDARAIRQVVERARQAGEREVVGVA